MGIENTRSLINENIKKPSVPPGFISLTSFTLKKVENSKEACSSMAVGNVCGAEPSWTDRTIMDIEKVTKHRPWILHNQLAYNPKGSEPELEMDSPLRACLPKGCGNCQKVISGWRPEESRRPLVEEAPVFHPTEEEFKDTLEYIASIRSKAEHFGICRIVPPPSWQPPDLIREKDVWKTYEFNTHIQQINDLKNPCSKRKKASTQEDMTVKRRNVSGQSSDYRSSHGCTTGANEDQSHDESIKSESGPEFTLEAFKNYADDFKSHYFFKKGEAIDSNIRSAVHQEEWEPLVENIEGEYWRIVDDPSKEIEVLCGANIESRVFGSGFPVNSSSLEMAKYPEYMESGWNLNNIPKLPGSLLRFENCETSAASVPRLFVGMCFSSICWKAEEHHLYSLCYMHLGSPKIWYGIPARYCYKFEGVLKKHLPQCSEHPKLLWRIITQLPLSLLTSEGIPVYRCVHYPREFVLTFPAVYHSEFDCGFNFSETVNFAPFDWLPYGQHVVELYSEQGRKTSLSHDKVLLGVAMEALKAEWKILVTRKNLLDTVPWSNICGKGGILTKTIKIRIKQEIIRREYLCSSLQSQKMDNDFDITTKRECNICLYDLYFSAIGCSCSPDKYTCLLHAKYLCSCAWDARFLLFRYEISELNVLVEALQGKLESLTKWGVEKLGLRMSSNVSTEAMQLTEHCEIPASMETAVSGAVSPGLKPSVCVETKESVMQQAYTKVKERENMLASLSVKRDVIILSDDEE